MKTHYFRWDKVVCFLYHGDVLGIDPVSLLHYNLFVYCWNNPVNMTDDNGYFPWFVAAAVGGALFDTAAYFIGSAISGQKITWAGIGKAALTGAATGVAFGALGKGGFNRAITSATRNATKYGDEVTSIMWKSAPDRRTAFIDEYLMPKRFGGVLSSNSNLSTYNKIWSPGRRYFGD